MILKRVLYSENKKINSQKKEEDLELLANKGIVGGSGTALLGGLSILTSSKLKKLGYSGKKVRQLGNIGKVLVPVGSGVAIYGGYLKHKSKKKKNEDKA